MDFTKNRIWVCNFYDSIHFKFLPQLKMVVEELESYPYRIPMVRKPCRFAPGYGGQLILVLDGTGIFEVGDQVFELNANQAAIYNYYDNRICYYSPRRNSPPWHFLWVMLIGEGSEKMISEINQEWGNVFDLGNNFALRDILLDFRRFSPSGCFLSSSQNSTLALQIMNLLIENQEEHSFRKTFKLPFGTVQKELPRLNKIGDLTSQTGLSRSHLSRSYRQLTGETMQHYRQRQRLNEALEYLLYSSLNLKEIADKVGFKNYSSFYRAFVKEYHISPSHFAQ